ncbi:hypothetical protein A6J66_016380 [Yersinia enterocolitica]|nr:hypothetical protein A6J66_016380 [Yersinia enterocolitica]
MFIEWLAPYNKQAIITALHHSSKWKIIVPGGAAGLQIQMGPPAVPGRFDSCDLPPRPISCFLYSSINPFIIIWLYGK